MNIRSIGICRTKYLQMIEHDFYLPYAWDICVNVVELEYHQQIGAASFSRGFCDECPITFLEYSASIFNIFSDNAASSVSLFIV